MSKITISPSHAILLLIQHYKTNHPNKIVDLDRLTHLYVEGTRNPDEYQQLQTYFNQHQMDVLHPYAISESHSVINNDPTRRYFESQLLFLTLKNDLNSIDFNALLEYVSQLECLLNIFETKVRDQTFEALEGHYIGENVLYSEYSEYIKRIKGGQLFTDSQGFNDKQRRTIQLLIKSSLLAVKCASSSNIDNYDPMPLDIYGVDLYELNNKGKITLSLAPEFSGNTRNQHYGLMKGHMPLYQDDVLLADSSIPHIKPSDQATYNINAKWPLINFFRLVHPYSNSISGTILCQLRALAYLHNKGLHTFLNSDKQFIEFFKSFISSIGFYGGGHSLFEFTYPFSLQAVSDELQLTSINFNQMNIMKIFSSKNIKQALDKAISYNMSYLKLKILNTQLKEYNDFNHCTALTLLSTKKIQSDILNALDGVIQDQNTPLIISNEDKKLLTQLVKEIETYQFDKAIITNQKLKNKSACSAFAQNLDAILNTFHNYYTAYNLRLFSIPVTTKPALIVNKLFEKCSNLNSGLKKHDDKSINMRPTEHQRKRKRHPDDNLGNEPKKIKLNHL